MKVKQPSIQHHRDQTLNSKEHSLSKKLLLRNNLVEDKSKICIVGYALNPKKMRKSSQGSSEDSSTTQNRQFKLIPHLHSSKSI
jgi:hypothetical protein